MFIIRSFNDQSLRENSSIELVAVSLVASLFSISNKFTWIDKDGVHEIAQEPRFKKRFPCINGWYLLRIVWRFSFVATRFCVLSLLWSVLGGAFLSIFLGISFFFSGMIIFFDEGVPDNLEDFAEHLWGCCILGCVSIVSTPTSEKISHLCLHGLEMIFSLTVITIFAYIEFDCGICADANDRQANNNPYIKMFIIAGWTTMGIDIITYGILLFKGIFKKHAIESGFEGMFAMFEVVEMA